MKEDINENNTINLINNRRTIRAYNSKSLSKEEENLIIQAAMRAPTAGNLMLYSILKISDQTLKDKLAITCDNQPHIAKAPLVLIFLADMQRWWNYFDMCNTQQKCEVMHIKYEMPQESDLLLACCDALIAAQNAVIAAEALSIGSCYIGDIMENYEIHREILKLPQWVFPITLICFGHPKGKKERIPLTPRFPQEFIVHTNIYHRLNEQDYKNMFQGVERKRAIEYAENLGQQIYFEKLGADFSKEMRRSVKAALTVWLNYD
jgi:FMN reductase (NADPH)